MKNLLLSAAMLCSPAVLLAQLYVQPNGATDSYVYVNDQVLFVEQDVNLQMNNPGTTRSSIYLRNNAQLIQGASASSNAGSGFLSVYRALDSTSAFHYSFFHSPVGDPNRNAGAPGNQNSGISRLGDCDTCLDTDTETRRVAYTSGHNGNSSTYPATVSTRWVYKKPPSPNTNVESNWVPMWQGTDAEPGLGFIMKGVSPGSNPATTIDYTFDFRGRPNNGDISINMPTGTERVLSGNPYPSAIDLSLVFYDPNNTIIESFWFWDEPKNSEYSHYYTDKTGGYGVWVPLGGGIGNPGDYVPAVFTDYTAAGAGTDTTGIGNDYDIRRFAPIAQGFEIKTIPGSSGTITFENSHRLFIKEDGVSSQYRSPNRGSGVYSSQNLAFNEHPKLRLNVLFNESYARPLLLGFDDSTSEKFDRGYDASSPMDAKSGEAYFTIDSDDGLKPYVINFTNFEMGKKIPLGFKLTKQTTLDFKVVEEVKIEHKAYLWDSQTNISQQINGAGGASLSLPAGTYHNRFYIVFRGNLGQPSISSTAILAEPGRGMEDPKEAMDFFQNNRLGVLEVSNPEGYTIKSASLFDMSGKLVYSEKNVGNSNSFSFPTANLSDGVYLVKLITDQDQQIDYKTSVFNKR